MQKPTATDSSLPPKRRRGRPPGSMGTTYKSLHAQHIMSALGYRQAGRTYREVGAELGVTGATAMKWTQAALASITQEHAELVKASALAKCELLMARLRAGYASPELIDGILQAQAHLLRLYGVALDERP